VAWIDGRRVRQAQAKRPAAARAAAGAWLTRRVGTSKAGLDIGAGKTGKPTAQIEPKSRVVVLKRLNVGSSDKHFRLSSV